MALVGHGLPYRVESTADLAILQFAKFRLWKDLDEHWSDFTDNPLVAHLVHEPTEAFADPARDTGRLRRPRRPGRAAARRRPTPRSCGRSPRPAPGARSCSRARPAPASRRPSPTCSPGRSPRASGCCSSPRSGRPWTSSRAGWTPSAWACSPSTCTTRARRASTVRAQIRLALEHAVAVDEQGLSAADGGPALGPPPAGPLRRPAARRRTPPGCRCTRRAPPSWPPAPTSSRCRCPLPFVANAPAEVLTSVRRALALLPDIADLTRPSLRHPWAFVDSPAIDLPATQAAAAAVDGAVREVSAIPELSGVLRRARTPDELDALVHLLSGPGDRPRRPRRDVHRALDGGDQRRARRGRGLHRVPPPGPGRVHARGAARCRWPRSTWPRRPPRRRPGSGASAG